MHGLAATAAIGLVGLYALSGAADLQPIQVPVSTEWSVPLPAWKVSGDKSDLATGSDMMEVGARAFTRPTPANE